MKEVTLKGSLADDLYLYRKGKNRIDIRSLLLSLSNEFWNKYPDDDFMILKIKVERHRKPERCYKQRSRWRDYKIKMEEREAIKQALKHKKVPYECGKHWHVGGMNK